MNAPFEFHVAPWINAVVDWVLTHWGAVFDAFAQVVLSVLLDIQSALMWVPWWAVIALTASASFLITRRRVLPLVLAALVAVIMGFGLWSLAVQTLAVIITSVALALAIGVPLGILMAEFDWVHAALQPVLDAMQTMPSFVYLIPAMMLFGLGKVPAVFATFIYATPPVIRLTDLGIRQVSAQVQEAARAFGATRWQVLKEVRLPLAMPAVMTGVNQTTMMALSMVVIASMIGARGIGQPVLLAINRIDVGGGFEAGFAVVALAIVIDRLTQGVARRWEAPSPK
ncbi:MAG TPA: proline/glycine betaine ABC transporter permease [Limnochordia bacterium]|nr:proline/glycine betaine ABC transporter permease [Limnochordia bacterium]